MPATVEGASTIFFSCGTPRSSTSMFFLLRRKLIFDETERANPVGKLVDYVYKKNSFCITRM